MNKKTADITVRVTPKELKKVKEIAKQQGSTVSNLVRAGLNLPPSN